MSTSDSQNFLEFLQDLRNQISAKNVTISAAVSVVPFLGPDGTSMTNVSDFADVLDHIAIMNYDINVRVPLRSYKQMSAYLITLLQGQWSNSVGPNAPLDDSCSTVQSGSATKAIKAWTDAGFPAEKILLGVPAYGHSFNVTTSNALDSSGNLASSPSFTKAPSSGTVDQCGNPVPVSDQMDFSLLISQGLLNSDGTPANGIKSRFDNCSQTVSRASPLI